MALHVLGFTGRHRSVRTASEMYAVRLVAAPDQRTAVIISLPHSPWLAVSASLRFFCLRDGFDRLIGSDLRLIGFLFSVYLDIKLGYAFLFWIYNQLIVLNISFRPAAAHRGRCLAGRTQPPDRYFRSPVLCHSSAAF